MGTLFTGAWLEHFDLQMESSVAFVNKISDILSGERRDFEQRVERYVEGMSQEAKEDYHDWVADEHDDLARRFPDTILRWHFVAVLSLVEAQYADLARATAKAIGATTSYKDFRSQKLGLDKALEYLEDVCHVKPGVGGDMETIKKFQKLRNCIVHADGLIAHMKSPTEQATVRSLRSSAGIVLPDSDWEERFQRVQVTLEIFPELSAAATGAWKSTVHEVASVVPKEGQP